jgi:peptide/nickel transport system substrate-binding protein
MLLTQWRLATSPACHPRRGTGTGNEQTRIPANPGDDQGGTGQDGAASSGPHRGGTLVMDMTNPVTTFDPAAIASNENIWVFEQIAQPLFRTSLDGKTVEPQLATGYSVSADHLTWTIHLRHGVKFSNGKPMTSKDVVFSLTRALNPKYLWYFINSNFKSVKAAGPYTVLLTTKSPWAPTASDLALFANAIFPANFGGQPAATFFQHPVGTGPFKLSKWVKGQSVQLVRNTYYWQPGRPYLNGVTYNYTPDSNARVLALKGGQAQIVEFVPYSLVSSVRAAGYNVTLFPSTQVNYYSLNSRSKPLTDPDVRRAISLATDRALINKSLFASIGKLAGSPLPPSMQYSVPTPSILTYDVAAAKKALAKSKKYSHGGFTLNFVVAGGDPVQTGAAQIFQAEMKPLNINVKISSYDQATVNAKQAAFAYDVMFGYYTNDITDVDEFFTFCFNGTIAPWANYTHYADPVVVSDISKAEHAFASSDRADLYSQALNKIASDQVLDWVNYTPFVYGYAHSVQGFHVNPEGKFRLQDVWLTK